MIAFDHITLGQRVLFGTGAAARNADSAVLSLGAERVLLISGASSRGLADEIAARTPVVRRIDEVVQHVPIENARAAIDAALEARVDAILAIGGGSSVGLAKVVARDTGLPIVAVPTTFSGSEATNIWGITEAGRKVTGVDDRALPKTIVYDASLMASLPARLAVSSGLNAVAHAVDGFWAPRADPINRALGTEGLRALISGLLELQRSPGSVEAREQALYGAYLAAVAFASAGSGMHHKICHALGGSYGMPHAETHSVMISYVTAFNEAAAPDAADRVLAALAAAGIGGTSAANGLEQLRRSLRSPASLSELGFQRESIPEAARIILPAIPESNPRPVTAAELEELLLAAWAGEALN